ncbi:siderophore-interacting protein [Gryllotalpicola ginsengisoli]|uniref:siderophore-interacting protein n=1 Tax=Gryllotalpicola ginsengisoli TaxID=444608 RepID=UPI000524A4B8|nr:siderophore-interacting protein [Gryllotalpicola ginsengisoli]
MLTLPTAPDRVRAERPAYRPYRVAVRAVAELSPTFRRVTFTGDELDVFGSACLDQRIKVIFPHEADDAPRGFDHLGVFDPDCIAQGAWYDRWRALPEELRNPFRTYTVRAVRQQQREIDVDFALHGDAGPASRWANRARPGDELVVVGPDDLSAGRLVGIDWRPGGCGELLLVGDETAVPAVCGILESLGDEVRATAFLEVPEPGDVLDVRLAPGHELTWLPRGGRERGAELVEQVRGWVAEHRHIVTPDAAAAVRPGASVALDESDVEAGLVWDAPDGAHDGFYAWIAGETSTVVTLRRHLVREVGVDRSRVAFMGYWRRGRAELS